MDFTLLLWLVVLVITSILVFFGVFSIVALTDLESDLVNPVDLARRLNPIFKLENIIHSVLSVILLIHFNIYLILWNLPLVVMHIMWYTNDQHRVFATEIFRVLPVYKKRYTLKTAFYIVSFFIYLYW
ncbi:hypothetical protein SAMD00019534_079590, partial [Acytostelium subglobosum LB1]|uniref:hypothetical protein n=1 Tax=Acytostelium subglobosum LB1 TaxID=1410327 RepID=UPI000644C0DF